MKYIWLKDGKPWKETNDLEGEKIIKEYFEGGVTRIIVYDDGNVTYERWRADGVLHRDGDKPVIIIYNKDGTVRGEMWYKDGQLHRDGGKSAVIYYNEDGTVLREEWWENGEEK